MKNFQFKIVSFIIFSLFLGNMVSAQISVFSQMQDAKTSSLKRLKKLDFLMYNGNYLGQPNAKMDSAVKEIYLYNDLSQYFDLIRYDNLSFFNSPAPISWNSISPMRYYYSNNIHQIDSSVMNNYTYETFTYDNADSLLVKIAYQWDSINAILSPSYKTSYSRFGVGGKVQIRLEQIYSNGIWVDMNKREYIYNVGNTEEILYGFQNGAWVYELKYTYFYNSQASLISNVQMQWANGQWRDMVRDTFMYSNSNLSEVVRYEYDTLNTQWRYHWKCVYQYAPQTEILLWANYDISLNMWNPYSRNKKDFDGDNDLTSSLIQLYDKNSNKYFDFYHYIYQYDDKSANIENGIMENAHFSVFPNPFRENLTILDENSGKNNHFILVDMQGKKVMDFTSNNAQISLETKDKVLKSGVYHLFLMKEQMLIFIQKIVKE